MSDWLTQLREAIEGYDKFIKPKDRPWQLAAVVDAARLLASGRRPDRSAIADAVDDATYEHLNTTLSAGAVNDIVDAVAAALGGSDVLIVDVPTEGDE